MNKEEKRVLRAKSLKVSAGEMFHAAVINAAAFLTIHSMEINGSMDQPTVAAMRAPLIPAYKVLAPALASMVGDKDITPERLTGLSVNMMAYLGKYEVSLKYHRPDGKVQPYVIKVSAADGFNVFMRVRAELGVEAAQQFIDQI